MYEGDGGWTGTGACACAGTCGCEWRVLYILVGGYTWAEGNDGVNRLISGGWDEQMTMTGGWEFRRGTRFNSEQTGSLR